MKHLRLVLLGLAAAVTMVAFGAVSTSQEAAAYDADGDGIPNEEDNCPFVATPWTVPEGDDDCDGWTTADEQLITTDPDLNCGVNAWPPDFDDNQVINILDVAQLTPPRYGMTSADPEWDPRYDIVPDGVINSLDMNRVTAVFGLTCTPDSDLDGFSDSDEETIGTDPNAACGVNAWPPDFDDNGVINILDVVQLTPPRYGTQPGHDDYSVRHDIVPDGIIDDLDLQKIADFFSSTCSEDTDGDGFSDADEEIIGTDPLAACGVNAWPPDFDDNAVINILDVVQLTPPRYGMKSTDPGWDPRYDIVPDGVIDDLDLNRVVAVFGIVCMVDTDGDGFSDADEEIIGTDPLAACGVNAWPPDFDDNAVINILDVVQLTPPRYGSKTGDDDYSVRHDIVPDGVIDDADLNRVVAVFGVSCMVDTDGDGFSDADELIIGTDPLRACGVNAWPPDFDDNTVINILDVVRLTPPRYGMTPADPEWEARYDIVPDGVIDDADLNRVVAVFGVTCMLDTDGDGFSDADEETIGTDPDAACGVDAWPPDFDDNAVINILDVVQLTPPRYGTQPGDPDYGVRYDIVPDDVIDDLDMERVTALFGLSCTP